MAQEIKVIARLTATKGFTEVERKIGLTSPLAATQGLAVDWAGNRHSANIADLGAVQELVAINDDIATAGFGIFRNVSTANVVATPAAPTVAVQGSTGGTAYSYRVSALGDTGETPASVAGNVNPLTTPTAPTVAPQGTTGTTSYSYRIVATNALGGTPAGTAGTTTTGNATLSSTNFNRVTWTAVTNATGYKVYGRVGGSEQLIATLGNVLTYDDTGAVTPSGALPTTNTTAGNATLSGTNFNRLTWTAAANATGYKVYGRTSGTEQLIATLGSVLTYDDTGAVTPAGALPTGNAVSFTPRVELGLQVAAVSTPGVPTVATQGATGAATYSYRVSATDANGETLAGTAGTIAPIASPAAPTVTPQGTAGTTSYSYRITATNSRGETLASTAGTTTTGNATLSGTNFNRVTWGSVADATGYKVYGRTGGSELLMATLGNVLTWDDTGAVTPAGALPAANTTGANATLSGSNFNRLTWPAVTGATGYKIYGRTAGSELLIATLGNVLTYDDTGSVTPAGALPAVNSTGFQPVVVMRPGEPAGPMRLKTRSLYARSVGGTAQIEHLVLEA